MGGLSRRNTVIEDERKKNPIVVVQAGADLTPGRITDGERLQREIKADLIAAAWKLGGIDGVALGSAEWALGEGVLFDLVKRHELPVVAANLVCDGEAPFPGHRVVKAGEARVAIVGLTDGVDSTRCKQTPAVEAVKATLQGVEADFTVLLSPFRSSADLAVFEGADLPIDVVVDASAGRIDRSPRSQAGLSLISAGARGKYVGVADLAIRPGGRGVRSENATQQLDRRIKSIKMRVTAMQARIDKEEDPRRKASITRQLETFQERLEQAKAQREAADVPDDRAHRLVLRPVGLDKKQADHPATKALVDGALDRIKKGESIGPAVTQATPRIAPQGSTYAGAQNCVACHRDQYVHWNNSGHARAWASLGKRQMDSDCWSCHATGANQIGGPTHPSGVAGFQDVQCEACHGAARAHTLDPANNKPVRTPTEQTCVTCHDGERDEGRFDFPSYFPKVIH